MGRGIWKTVSPGGYPNISNTMTFNLMVSIIALKEKCVHSLLTNYPSYCDFEVMSAESGNETLRMDPAEGRVYGRGGSWEGLLLGSALLVLGSYFKT